MLHLFCVSLNAYPWQKGRRDVLNALDVEANGSRVERRRVVVGLQPRRDGGVDGGGQRMRGGHVCQVDWAEVSGRRSAGGQVWFGLFMVQRGVSWFRGFAVSRFCLQTERHTVCVRHTGYIKMTAAHRRRRLSSRENMSRPCNDPANRFKFNTTPSGGKVHRSNVPVRRFNFKGAPGKAHSTGSGAKSGHAVLHATKSIA